MAELFSLLGLVSASVLACNLQPMVSQRVLPWWRFDPAIAQFSVFLLLFIVGLVLLVRIVARTLARLISWNQTSAAVRLLSAIVGAGRGLWLAGMLALIGLASQSAYVTQSIEGRALSGPRLVAGMRVGLEQARLWYPGDRLSWPAVPMLPPASTTDKRHGAHS